MQESESSHLEERKLREREFHNDRERLRREDHQSHDGMYSNRKFYSVAHSSDRFMEDWLAERSKGKRVLYYCCGTGEFALNIARYGAKVDGIDIADECIKTANETSGRLGLAETCQFFTMDAEHTDYEADTFDIIVAIGCLHHLDLNNAYRELSRILKPDGLLLCNEAVADNPFIMAYRKLTPHLRTEYEAEHILSVKDIRSSKEYFGSLDLTFFHYTVMAALPFRKTLLFAPVLKVLEKIDRKIARIPVVRNWAWQSVFVLSQPRI